jgi:hypothetical protein
MKYRLSPHLAFLSGPTASPVRAPFAQVSVPNLHQFRSHPEL